ncbi:hypothetical protein [Jannaschia aquimarina]|uniref:Uncharacterized protein n=1 Tax=Jannaschia aquimarina TaxID=935700 RepID=A0A0D1CKQ7_9RHOB|nr:hypothetical protein [Jannaschia aquimarina]KIT15357.1 hypothetical protein jaqu_29720 [Jannaschia aquimarina]SNS51994.1 hypothetical protein SAMN05421775_101286 [Jannaschia aquimarina]
MRLALVPILAGLLLACTATPQLAQEPLSGPRANVARALPFYGFGDVDVERLSNNQVMQIYSLIHSERSQGDIRQLIRSTIEPGLLQRGVDRLRDRL